ncbi:MAG: DUF4340 domain-containing protein [Candidatus Binatia bacterium]
MTWRRVGLYYLLAAVLGSYFFLFEWRPNKIAGLVDPDTALVQESRFLPISRDDVHEFVLKRGNTALVFRRNGEQWTAIEPSDLDVPSDLLTSFVENLTPTKEVRVVDTNPKDPTAFGLNPPNTTIIVKNKAGKEIATVSLGSHNPTSSAVYARIEPAPEVYLLGYSVGYYAELVFEKVGSGTPS